MTRWPAALVGSALLLVSCSSPRNSLPRIAALYSDAAMRETRNPVIVIHGVLGARLAQRSTGKTVWGAFTRAGVDPNSEEGACAIGLPLDPPASAAAYDMGREDVYAAGPLDALQLDVLFTVVSVEVYAGIIRTLGAGGYTDNIALDPLSRRTPRTTSRASRSSTTGVATTSRMRFGSGTSSTRSARRSRAPPAPRSRSCAHWGHRITSPKPTSSRPG